MEADDIKLTWEDLVVENISPEEATAWLHDWDWFISGELFPVFLSRFGNWFLRRPDGKTELLDVIDGTLKAIADTPDEFQTLVNTQVWQEEFL